MKQPPHELLAELKAYVFAMYIGQKVLKYDLAKEVAMLIYADLKPSNLDYASELQLRPLSSITDSEAIEVAKIVINEPSHYDNSQLLYVGKKYSRIGENNLQMVKAIAINSYLQQSGFALPIYFKGVQYSVETLVEYGIIKLNP